ncbi:hypothetical protein QQP08_022730 [Theobroma cacao]|nr:hypothetical protein QQP08_022730 [Theobroma cacao]
MMQVLMRGNESPEPCLQFYLMQSLNVKQASSCFKDELSGLRNHEFSPEFGIVLDADHLDAIGAIATIRLIQGMVHEERGADHEKLLKLKDLMKTKAGQRRAKKRHKLMEEFLKELYKDWDRKA